MKFVNCVCIDTLSSPVLSREFILQVAKAIPMSWARCSKVIIISPFLCTRRWRVPVHKSIKAEKGKDKRQWKILSDLLGRVRVAGQIALKAGKNTDEIVLQKRI